MVSVKKLKAILVYMLVYALAIGAAWATIEYTSQSTHIMASWSTLSRALLADMTACMVIFLACVVFNSFSINDLYWTLQATCLSIYYFIVHNNKNSSSGNLEEKNVSPPALKSLLILVLVNLWSARLSYNLLSTGLHHVSHEDWRFVLYRSQWRPRPLYFLVGLFAFILLPNLIVYVACIPVYFVLNPASIDSGAADMKLLDWFGFLVTLLGN